MSENRRQHRRSMRSVHSHCFIFYFSVKSNYHDNLPIVDVFSLSHYLPAL